MLKLQSSSKSYGKKLPLLVEKDEDGFFVIECPVFEGCYTQGKTLKETKENLKEALLLIFSVNKMLSRSDTKGKVVREQLSVAW